jgi:hypothetical protein
MLSENNEPIRLWNPVVNNKYNNSEAIKKDRLTKEEQSSFINQGSNTVSLFANVFFTISYKLIAKNLKKDVCKDKEKIEGSHYLYLVTQTKHLIILSGLHLFDLF